MCMYTRIEYMYVCVYILCSFLICCNNDKFNEMLCQLISSENPPLFEKCTNSKTENRKGHTPMLKSCFETSWLFVKFLVKFRMFPKHNV